MLGTSFSPTVGCSRAGYAAMAITTHAPNKHLWARPRMAELLTALLQVNADIAVGAEYLWRIHQIVADLEQSGQDTEAARQLLQEAEANQAIYVAEADRLANELAALPAENTI